MYHSIPIQLPTQWGKGAVAIVAGQPTGHAVVFVHGFAGHAVNTWNEFIGLLPDSPHADGVDLYFFGFDSLNAPVLVSGAKLRSCLDSMWSDPRKVLRLPVNHPFSRAESFRYQRVTVVAHSMGAIVARVALLDSLQSSQHAGWGAKSELVFFAPAHSGASIVGYVQEALSGIPEIGNLATTTAATLKARFPGLSDLEPNSPVLSNLQTRAAAIGASGFPCVWAKKVIHAEHERVVFVAPFGQDPPVDYIDGVNHQAVCKPSSIRREPLTHLEACL